MRDHLEKQSDQTQKLDSGQGAGLSSQFDLSRHLLGADRRRNTCIPQGRLFKDYISYGYRGPDGPPQYAEETLPTSFRHDAPSQESPMSALGSLEKIRDGGLLLQADNYYAQGQYKQAELALRCILDNCAKEPERNGLKIDLTLHGLAKVYKKCGRYGDAEEVYKFLIDYHMQEHQPDDRKIGAAVKGLGEVYEKQGKSKEAKALFKSSLLICKEQFGENDPRTAGVMKSLAKVYEKMEKPAKAKALLHEYVLPIFKEKLGENDSKTEIIRKKLTDLPVKPGQEELVITRGTRRLIAERWVNTLLNFMKFHKRFPDICDPQLFNDKALHRNLFDRRPIRTQFADKYAVRQYVKDRIGEEYLPKLYHVTTDPSTIPFKDLPNKFVIKSTQGARCLQVRVVTDKSTINEPEIREECNKWLNQVNDHYKATGSWAYKHVKPQIIIEEYINDGKGKVAPYDYKFFTYNGVSNYIQVNTGRFVSQTRDIYDTQWNKLQIEKGGGKNNPTPIPRPPHLAQMLELAHKLGKGVEFARIDFYDTPEKVFLGEITSIPSNGLAHFEPAMYDRLFGEPWKEVYNKCSIPSLPPSHEVCQILRQITCGTHKVVLEGQRNRQYSQEIGEGL
jgi:tetratricopeptide (TPR) repeat protein